MKRAIAGLVLCLFASGAYAQNVTVDFSVEEGPVKLLNGVNGGILNVEYAGYTSELVRQAHIPYFRSHDIGDNTWYGAGHCVDISCIFPDFNANVNDPKSYDFHFTDAYIKDIIESGSQVYYRLGQTIEHGKAYHVYPPKNYKKWARICEHIIRHYNEGWADGFHYDIKYWQIWNEHDHSKPVCWIGTPEQFYDLYETTYWHLKNQFPDLQIGGPALLGNPSTGKAFIEAMARRNVPLDFLSWHMYFHTVEAFKYNVNFFRETLDENGYKDTPSFIDEWNIKPFDLTQSHYMTVLTAATMCAGQHEPVDMMLYYDVLPGSSFNNIFTIHGEPMPAYWAFYSWGKMTQLGTSVQAKADMPEIQVAAATNADKTNSGILISRLNVETGIPQLTDPNVRIPRSINPKMDVTIAVKGVNPSKVRVRMVDEKNTYQPYPVKIVPTDDGCTITVSMARMSFAYITLK